ncbi:MAG: glycosyltransferase family 2 protein [Clostridia bacterium]|nr:glycosyltransferase family 2 protein [Clostridia bacterium]
MKTLALVVPCYNEADVLRMFYDETSKVIDSLKENYVTEIVFVDDGSRDDTLKIIKELASINHRVKYISFSRNFGKEAAMLAGMDYAVKADYIGILDADLQHSPTLIPEMLKYVDEEGYDVAAARREDRKGEAKLKSFLSESFYKVINKVSETKIIESAQDFRIMRKDVVKAIVSMPESIRFSKGIFSWVGFNVKWIGHTNRERAAGDTKWSITKLAKYAIDGILGFTTSPLKLSFLFSFLCIMCSGLNIVYALIRNIINLQYAGTVPYIMAGMLFIASLIFICMGIMGEYLARVYTESKDRPKYIVSQSNTQVKYSFTADDE